MTVVLGLDRALLPAPLSNQLKNASQGEVEKLLG